LVVGLEWRWEIERIRELADRVGSRNKGMKPLFSTGIHVSSSLRQIIIEKLVDFEWVYRVWKAKAD
jgi:hypothetical protein